MRIHLFVFHVVYSSHGYLFFRQTGSSTRCSQKKNMKQERRFLPSPASRHLRTCGTRNFRMCHCEWWKLSVEKIEWRWFSRTSYGRHRESISLQSGAFPSYDSRLCLSGLSFAALCFRMSTTRLTTLPSSPMYTRPYWYGTFFFRLHFFHLSHEMLLLWMKYVSCLSSGGRWKRV